MDKYEILEKSRNENQNEDLYTTEVENKAQKFSGIVAVNVAFALMLIERIILDDKNNLGYTLIIGASGTAFLYYRGIKLKKKKDIVFAVITTVMTVFVAVEYFLALR